MPVTDITKDLDNRTLTLTARFAAPVQRLWDLYADPHQIEQVWGPPTYPATFVQHELTPGSQTRYYMTSPEGEKFCGLWDITSTDEPHGFAFIDSFADADFQPVGEMPSTEATVCFTADGDETVMTWTSVYASAHDMQKVLDMGMEEGARQATNQIDDFLARHPAA